MTEAEIKATIFETLHRIAPESDPTQLKGGDDLGRTLDIDSFDFLNLVIGLHEKLGVEIPETDYGKLRTLDALINYLGVRVEHQR